MQDHDLTKLEIIPENATYFADVLTKIYDRKASEIFVIMNKEETTILKNPGLSRPWSSLSFKQAELTSREVGSGAHATTLQHALKKLIAYNAKRN